MRKIWLLGALVFVGCCGYSTRALLPGYLKTIYIAKVENRTLRPMLAEQLNDELTASFTRDGRLRVSSEPSADLALTLSVDGYKRLAAVYDASRNVSQWKYQLRLRGECRDQVKNTTLWEDTKTVEEVLDADVDEEEAIAELLQAAAEAVVRDVLLAW